MDVLQKLREAAVVKVCSLRHMDIEFSRHMELTRGFQTENCLSAEYFLIIKDVKPRIKAAV